MPYTIPNVPWTYPKAHTHTCSKPKRRSRRRRGKVIGDPTSK